MKNLELVGNVQWIQNLQNHVFSLEHMVINGRISFLWKVKCEKNEIFDFLWKNRDFLFVKWSIFCEKKAFFLPFCEKLFVKTENFTKSLNFLWNFRFSQKVFHKKAKKRPFFHKKLIISQKGNRDFFTKNRKFHFFHTLLFTKRKFYH